MLTCSIDLQPAAPPQLPKPMVRYSLLRLELHVGRCCRLLAPRLQRHLF